MRALIGSVDGLLISSPEYARGVAGVLKNALDWVSRVRETGDAPRAPFRDRIFALGAASNGTYGGYRSLIALRHVLELGCGALVLPDQVAIRNAASAFDEAENLRDAGEAERLRSMLARLNDVAHQYAQR